MPGLDRPKALHFNAMFPERPNARILFRHPGLTPALARAVPRKAIRRFCAPPGALPSHEYVAEMTLRPLHPAALAAAFLLALPVAGGGAPTAVPRQISRSGSVDAPPDTVEIVRRPVRLLVGQRVKMAARVLGPDGAKRGEAPLAWRATSSSYVSLAADGRITGVRPGRVGIRAVSGSDTTSFTLEVLPNDVAAVDLTPDHSTARVGDTVSIHLSVRNGSGADIEGILAEWEVTPESATIDDSGRFVASDFGLYTVIARIGDRKAIATVRVAVDR